MIAYVDILYLWSFLLLICGVSVQFLHGNSEFIIVHIGVSFFFAIVVKFSRFVAPLLGFYDHDTLNLGPVKLLIAQWDFLGCLYSLLFSKSNVDDMPTAVAGRCMIYLACVLNFVKGFKVDGMTRVHSDDLLRCSINSVYLVSCILLLYGFLEKFLYHDYEFALSQIIVGIFFITIINSYRLYSSVWSSRDYDYAERKFLIFTMMVICILRSVLSMLSSKLNEDEKLTPLLSSIGVAGSFLVSTGAVLDLLNVLKVHIEADAMEMSRVDTDTVGHFFVHVYYLLISLQVVYDFSVQFIVRNSQVVLEPITASYFITTVININRSISTLLGFHDFESSLTSTISITHSLGAGLYFLSLQSSISNKDEQVKALFWSIGFVGSILIFLRGVLNLSKGVKVQY